MYVHLSFKNETRIFPRGIWNWNEIMARRNIQIWLQCFHHRRLLTLQNTTAINNSTNVSRILEAKIFREELLTPRNVLRGNSHALSTHAHCFRATFARIIQFGSQLNGICRFSWTCWAFTDIFARLKGEKTKNKNKVPWAYWPVAKQSAEYLQLHRSTNQEYLQLTIRWNRKIANHTSRLWISL